MSEDKKNEMVELSDDQIEPVAGGASDSKESKPWVPECPYCGTADADTIMPTGEVKQNSLFGLPDEAQYYCKKCRRTFWH